MYVPPFLLYQETDVPEMCTKTLNEKPVDMSEGTGGEPGGGGGLQFSLRLSWANSRRAAMRCFMAVWSSHRGWLLGTWMSPAPLLLPPALQTQLKPGDGWNRPEPTSALFMGPESSLPSVRTRHSECHYIVGGGEKKNNLTSDIEMNYALVTVLEIGRKSQFCNMDIPEVEARQTTRHTLR